MHSKEALLLQVTMCACTVYTSITTGVDDCGEPKTPATLAATAAVLCTANHCCSCQHFGKLATHKQGGAPGFKYSSGNTG